jgi:hypothetical protein
VTAESLAADLRATAADLDGYIERRAAEHAAPLIAEAKDRADERVAEAQALLLREKDVLVELRRYIRSLNRQVTHWHDVATGKAGDFILRNDEVHEGDRLLDSDVELETVTSVAVYDDHLGISVTRASGRQSYLDRQPDALTAVRRELATPRSEGTRP